MSRPGLNKNTELYISIAERPSNTGTTIFNAAFEYLGIDAVYKACAVQDSDLAGAVAGIRSLGIRGCGVSMPFKKDVLTYLDEIDSRAQRVGAVNTIVNEAGRLIGYNTDVDGASAMLRKIAGLQKKSVVLLGAGGVAEAVSCALVELGAKNVVVINRSIAPASKLGTKWGFKHSVSWKDRNKVMADLLINATSIGMAPNAKEMPISIAAIQNFEIIMDVVATPPVTRLTKIAAAQGRQILQGSDMALLQAFRQFKLYTGQDAPETLMRDELVHLSGN